MVLVLIAAGLARLAWDVPGIGLPEYAWLVENRVTASAPARIVLGLFVGNDISGLASREERGFYSLQQMHVFELARRLLVLRRQRSRGRDGPDTPGRTRGAPRSDEDGGTLPREMFLEIEQASVELCNTSSRHMDRLYRAAFAWIARLHKEAGDRLLVVLFPDEYQVNDELYATLMARVPEPAAYERLHPQTRIAAFCRRRGIEVLDLLDPLRRANGERPVYKLRDTHWNARGNRVAGEAIAVRLLDGARRQEPPAPPSSAASAGRRR